MEARARFGRVKAVGEGGGVAVGDIVEAEGGVFGCYRLPPGILTRLLLRLRAVLLEEALEVESTWSEGVECLGGAL